MPPASPLSQAPLFQSGVFKGHRFSTSIDAVTRQATIELDDRKIATLDAIAEIGKINTIDLQTSFLLFIRVKSTAGCTSYVMVRTLQAADAGKSEVITDFGACNDKLQARLEAHEGWASWYAVAYRDDRATVQVAFIADDKLVTREAKALPCLFVPVAPAACMDSIEADATGAGELGVPMGGGAFADQKISTFLNRVTGKATVKLNGRVFRTFDNAKDFYLTSVDGDDQFGLFMFYLRPATGCVIRPLMFFASRESEPQVIADYAPCTDRVARLKRKKGNTIEFSALAFHLGEPKGYIASVTDHKLSTRNTLLPVCMMQTETSRDENCAAEAFGGPSSANRPPRQYVVPAPRPGGLQRTPRPLGI